jgi:hypothetical protein
LVDAGGGTFLRFGEAGGSVEDLDRIAISHLHTDHVADLPALLKGGYLTGAASSARGWGWKKGVASPSPFAPDQISPWKATSAWPPVPPIGSIPDDPGPPPSMHAPSVDRRQGRGCAAYAPAPIVEPNRLLVVEHRKLHVMSTSPAHLLLRRSCGSQIRDLAFWRAGETGPAR